VARKGVDSVSPAGLRAFFQRLVFPGFAELGIADREVVQYVVGLLARFARVDQLYHVRDARGQGLETIAEMLVELGRDRQPQGRWSFDRDMEIRRHVGDYALFTSGLFRPWVERQDLVEYYFEQGRQAYRALAEMAELSYAAEGKLFRAWEKNSSIYRACSTTCAKSICGPSRIKGRTRRCRGIWSRVRAMVQGARNRKLVQFPILPA